MKKWILLGATFLGVQAQATGPSLTYHGRILDSNGVPVTAAAVQFKIQIRTPGSENCLMYEEGFTKNLSTTSGTFAITINNGTGTRSDSSGLTMEKIFSNRAGFTFGAGQCSSGTTYTPASTDGRSLIVYFNDGSFAGWEAIPQQAINLVPQAIDALQVGGFNASSLLRVESGAGPQSVASLSPTNFLDLAALLTRTTTYYAMTASPVTPVSGQVWYNAGDNKFKYYDGTTTTNVGPQGTSTINSLTVGSNLTAGGTAGGTLNSSGTIDIKDSGVGAGTYTKVTVNAKGLVTGSGSLATSDLPTLPAIPLASGVSGTLPVANGGTGVTSLAGTFILNGAQSGSVIFGSNDGNNVTIKSNNAAVMTVDTSGRVGIGTTSPQSKLDVNGVVRATEICDETGANCKDISAGWAVGTIDISTGTTGTLPVSRGGTGVTALPATFVLNGAQAGAVILGSSDSNSVTIKSNNSAAITVDSSGKVGIGTASPNEKMDVAGKIRATHICATDGTNCKDLSTSWSAGSVTSVATGTGLTGGPITSTGTISLEDVSGLTPGSYGSATAVPAITVDAKGRVTAVSTNSISGLLPAASGASGKYLKSDGTSWAGADVKFSDIKNAVGGSAINVGSCAANQTVAWSSLTDSFTCQNIGSLDGSTISAGTIGAARLGTGTADNTKYLRGDGTWQTLSAAETDPKVGANTTSYLSKWDGSALVASGVIESSGKIGIGTATPAYVLDVNGAVNTTGVVLNGNASTQYLNYALTGATGGQFAIYNNTTSAAGYTFIGGAKHAASHLDLSSVAGTANGTSDYIRFITGAQLERVRIDTNGNVGIGTTSPSYTLDVKGLSNVTSTAASVPLNVTRITSSANSAEIAFRPVNTAASTPIWVAGLRTSSDNFSITSNDGSTFTQRMVIDPTGNVGIGTTTPGYSLDVNGTIRMVSFISSSDRRLKKNISPSPGLDLIEQIEPHQYDWKKDGRHDYGVIAQELEAIVPELVSTDPQGMKAVRYQSLIAPLIKSVQELSAENKRLSKELEEIKAMLKEQKH